MSEGHYPSRLPGWVLQRVHSKPTPLAELAAEIGLSSRDVNNEMVTTIDRGPFMDYECKPISTNIPQHYLRRVRPLSNEVLKLLADGGESLSKPQQAIVDSEMLRASRDLREAKLEAIANA